MRVTPWLKLDEWYEWCDKDGLFWLCYKVLNEYVHVNRKNKIRVVATNKSGKNHFEVSEVRKGGTSDLGLFASFDGHKAESLTHSFAEWIERLPKTHKYLYVEEESA